MITTASSSVFSISRWPCTRSKRSAVNSSFYLKISNDKLVVICRSSRRESRAQKINSFSPHLKRFAHCLCAKYSKKFSTRSRVCAHIDTHRQSEKCKQKRFFFQSKRRNSWQCTLQQRNLLLLSGVMNSVHKICFRKMDYEVRTVLFMIFVVYDDMQIRISRSHSPVTVFTSL